MAQEQKFLNNCFFRESKYGFKIALDPEALKNLKLVNGKYQIEAKKARNGDKWYMVEDTWVPQPRPADQANSWKATPLPSGDFQVDDDLPF